MVNENLKYPLGIRPWQSELRSGQPHLREGYAFTLLENCTDSYRFTALADASTVADIFRSFAACLPEEAFFILEFYQDFQDDKEDDGDDPVPIVYYSPYLPTKELLGTIEPYLHRLIHDGFVGFGLANNRAGMELFYSEEKVLTSFTSNHIRLMDLFTRHGLTHQHDLLYPADYGHDHLSLLCHPRETLPEPFSNMPESELDYIHFCGELTEMLDMYPVEESLSFFLSKKDQDAIEERLLSHPEFEEFCDEDFGSLLLDWNDFVTECEAVFEGDLWEYHQGLNLRDMIQFVAEGVPLSLRRKILDIVAEADERFQKNLVDRRKRLDPPGDLPVREDRFWYHGVVRNQGAYLRRDLIRQGWYKPAP